VKGFPIQFEAIRRENSPASEYLHANIRLCVNIFKRIFIECKIRLKVFEYRLQNEYFEANIRYYEKILIEYSL
jgi:hypothetical protein